jgi:hypothetical protein
MLEKAGHNLKKTQEIIIYLSVNSIAYAPFLCEKKCYWMQSGIQYDIWQMAL